MFGKFNAEDMLLQGLAKRAEAFIEPMFRELRRYIITRFADTANDPELYVLLSDALQERMTVADFLTVCARVASAKEQKVA